MGRPSPGHRLSRLGMLWVWGRLTETSAWQALREEEEKEHLGWWYCHMLCTYPNC